MVNCKPHQCSDILTFYLDADGTLEKTMLLLLIFRDLGEMPGQLLLTQFGDVHITKLQISILPQLPSLLLQSFQLG